MNETIYLALGSNLGDRAANLLQAIHALSPAVAVWQKSSVYLTPPWGYQDQPPYLNQVIAAHTDLKPLPLLQTLKAIETEMGRYKTFRYGPRLIDLDILFYGQRVIDIEGLQIPHPRLAERAFVLIPLHEIAPDLIHPVLQLSISDLLAQVDAEGVIRL